MIALYMDENVPRAVTRGLRRRGVDVLTVQEDGRAGTPDPQVLDRAAMLDRLLVTYDDLIAEVVRRLRGGQSVRGAVYAHEKKVSIGRCISDLELIAKAGRLEEYQD